MLIRTLGTNFSEVLSEFRVKNFAFEKVVCEKAVILSRPQCVNLKEEGESFRHVIISVVHNILDVLCQYKI